MRTIRAALGASATLHVAALLLLIFGAARAPGAVVRVAQTSAHSGTPIDVTRIVFVAPPRLAPASGGGGGGGNRGTEPIRRAQGPGKDDETLRTRRRPQTVSALPPLNAMALPAVVLDARSIGSGGAEQMGLPAGGVPLSESLGPGSGGGAGSGVGTGIGEGRGPGIGPGSGGGTGGGVYVPGGQVTAPQLLHRVDPRYTSQALERRIEGSVWLDVVVTPRGEPSNIRISRSLDADLDAEAIKAMQQWRFEPGRLGAVPVNVAVLVVMDFRIR